MSKGKIPRVYRAAPNLFIAVMVVITVSLIGISLVLFSQAATPLVSIEPEDGTITSSALAISDSSASGGKAIQFNPAPIVDPPAPPPTPPGINRKKGIGASKYAREPNVNLPKLEDLRVNWYYDWSPTPPAGSTYMEYVPMLWNETQVTPATISALKAGKESGKYKHLLTFNEPNGINQANMTVNEAIELWPQLQSTGLRLVSPAPTTPTGTTNSSTPGVPWIDDFMNKANARGYKVDVIALHYYGDWTRPGAVDSLRNSMQSVYNKHKKPIWITEIGTIDVKNAWGGNMVGTPTFAGANTYMQQLVPMLESLPFIERYAWFADNYFDGSNLTAPHNYTSLYNASHVMTNLGKTYQGY